MSKLSQNIVQLRSAGKTYDEIVIILKCSKGTVSYHCGVGQKQKQKNRHNKTRKTAHPYRAKLEHFKYRKYKPKNIINKKSLKNHRLIQMKIKTFFRNRKTRMYLEPTFTVQDIINKFGENPICYLTGKPIEISKPRTYHFDHIIPTSKGGDNSIDNLGICTKEANQAKNNLSYNDFIKLCKQVIDQYNQRVELESNQPSNT